MNVRNVMLGPRSGMYKTQVNLISILHTCDAVCFDSKGSFRLSDTQTYQSDIVELMWSSSKYSNNQEITVTHRYLIGIEEVRPEKRVSGMRLEK